MLLPFTFGQSLKENVKFRDSLQHNCNGTDMNHFLDMSLLLDASGALDKRFPNHDIRHKETGLIFLT